MIKTLVNPNPKDALQFINVNHRKKAEKTFLCLIGDCTVDYHGRAKSFLDWGERIIMIKQDGNLLVHQSTMREPINWQPPGSTAEFHMNNDFLVINSRHRKPDEKMKIVIRNLQLVFIAELKDSSVLKIAGMEADVVNQIMDRPDCIEEGLRIKQREKQVKSGMIDLYGYDKDHVPVIIEVKRSLATISSVHQLRMYVKDVKKNDDQVKVRGILCAPRIPDMVKYLCKDYELEYQEIDRKVVIPDDWQKTLQDFL